MGEDKSENNKKSIATYAEIKNILIEIYNIIVANDAITETEKRFVNILINNRSFISFLKSDNKAYSLLCLFYNKLKQRPKALVHSKTILLFLENYWNSFSRNKSHKNLRDIEKLNKTADDKIKELDKDIEQNLNKSREMLGEQAGNTNAKRYFDYAEKNRKSARWLFWFSVAIMGSLGIFSAFALYFTDITSKDLFVRISIFFAILLPAFFMMREAKKLKDKEFQYTDMAYRIVTSEPYIDGLNLSPEEKAKLKAALVKDFFGRSIECRDDGGLPPIDNICEIIKTCLESCKKD